MHRSQAALATAVGVFLWMAGSPSANAEPPRSALELRRITDRGIAEATALVDPVDSYPQGPDGRHRFPVALTIAEVNEVRAPDAVGLAPGQARFRDNAAKSFSDLVGGVRVTLSALFGRLSNKVCCLLDATAEGREGGEGQM